MSILRNLLGVFVPVRERRESAGVLAALNAELTLDLNGDESASILLLGGGATLTATVEVTGSVDGTTFLPVLMVPYQSAGAGTLPNNGQPLIVDAISAANAVRQYAARVGQLKKLRVRFSAYTAGAADVFIVSDATRSLHPSLFEGCPTSLLISATAAAGALATATLPAVAGLRHYIDFIRVTRFASTALTAAAAPVLVTTSNLPGALVIAFPAESAAQGIDIERGLDFGGTGLSALAIGTVSSVTCPATAGVLWRLNVGYRLGV